MDNTNFWNVIESIKIDASQTTDREKQLEIELSSKSPEEIKDFYDICFQYIDEAYSWNLWDAAQIITAHCPDKAFVKFRCWLILEGKEIYNKILKNPDELANYPKQKLYDFETSYSSNLLEILSRIYKQKTGDFLLPSKKVSNADPVGEMISEEDYDTLKKKYPRLFEKYLY